MRGQCYSIPSNSEGRHRRLRNIPPEIGIVTEEQGRAALLQGVQPVERGQHLLTVVDEARQPSFTQRAAEVAGVAGQHDLALVGAYPQGLMSRRVTPGRDADDAAVPEQVVLALDLPDR